MEERTNMKLISIIVPTTRPENGCLESFFKFEIPENYQLEYIFIIDDPTKSLDKLKETVKKYSKWQISIIKNESNLGASRSRNIGLEKARGEFILSLDDDCEMDPKLIKEYVKAYESDPNHPGYIGLTSAPEPISNFDKAIKLSDMRHFFEIANHKNEFFWGITANLFLKREAVGNIRFSEDHPKKGGGEDIAFCLKVLENYTNHDSKQEEVQLFKCVPEAKVEHPYWKEDVNGYKRFFRWGYGDVLLHETFPEYRFKQYPNLIEMSFLSFILSILIFGALSANILSFIGRFISFSFLTGLLSLSWEIICEALKFKENHRKFKKTPLFKAVLIRLLNDLGRFIRQFPRLWKICSRWDYFCTGESIEYETQLAMRKFYGFMIIYGLILTIFVLI